MSAGRRPAPPTAAELHRRWLQLVNTDGPFLSVPTLKRVWPQGMPALAAARHAAVMDARPAFERAWDRWHRRVKDDAAAATYASARDRFVPVVLTEMLGWDDFYAADLAGLLADAEAWSPDRRVAIRPSGALRYEDQVGALVLVVDPVESLQDLVDDGWAASPIDRMEALLRAAGVDIGVVTDGRWWVWWALDVARWSPPAWLTPSPGPRSGTSATLSQRCCR